MAAFDAHRRGKHQPKSGERGRRCVAPEDAADSNGGDLFMALTTDGICDLYSEIPERHVTIWTLKAGYERVSTAFRKSHRERTTRAKRTPARKQQRVRNPRLDD